MSAPKPYIIGISGGSASGKTRFLQAIAERFESADITFLSQDNYYKSADYHVKDENGHINYDLPGCIDLDRFHKDLLTLMSGKKVEIQEYRFQHQEQFGRMLTLNPSPVIIVEGLFIYYDENIKQLFDLKIFVDAKEEVQYKRRLQRDTAERNISADFVKYQWEKHVLPSFNKYLLPYKDEADIVVINNTHFENSLNVIANHIKMVLNV
jgi:uridine kinase